MRYRSMFDIIGPAMIGPSSSHTAGANRIGQVARRLYGGTPDTATITFYGSFAETYQGHGTDRAIVAGLMGFKADDTRIRDALEIAAQQQLHYRFEKGTIEGIHPNSVTIRIDGDRPLFMTGISIGGGSIEIIEYNGYNIRFSGDYPMLIVEHTDRVGVVKEIATILVDFKINVSHMEVDRKERAGQALSVIEVDEAVPDVVLNRLGVIESIVSLRHLEAV